MVLNVFRRPLRVYLHRIFLLFIVVTFALQVGYMFMPVHTTPPPVKLKSGSDSENNLPLEDEVDLVQQKGVHINDVPQNNVDVFVNNTDTHLFKQRVADAKKSDNSVKDSKVLQDLKIMQSEVQPNQNGCKKTILILGAMDQAETWSELTTLVHFLKQYPNENNVTYRAPLYCPLHKCTIELTFSSNYTKEMAGKNAVILGVVPYTLLIRMKNLLNDVQSQDQLWMMYGAETALRMHNWIPNLGRLPVHGIWSYLSNSQIHMPYAFYKPGPPVIDQVKQLDNFWIKSKNKMIAWMGRNCVKEVFWPRMAYIHELQKHVHIDTYGKCGNLTCMPRLSEKCKHVMSSYKFYLSVENAECEEYMTEKIWDTALQHGVVPVVYGAPKQHYETLAPPNSFIYVGDFNSPKELATYLKTLDKRPDLYAKYFEWRYNGSVTQVYPNLQPSKFCEVLPFINMLQNGSLEKKPVSAYPWFNTCRTKITKPFNLKDIPSIQQFKPW